MYVIICPGMHDRSATHMFVAALQGRLDSVGADQFTLLTFPADRYPAYSAWHILRFLHEQLGRYCPDDWLQTPLVLIGFSAGVVGAMGAAIGWQGLGGTVKALIAIDGWGVPLAGSFPLHRLSHDYFTHWSSALLGQGEDSFYADPDVAHLDLWRSPETARGWWISASGAHARTLTNAASFLTALLARYSEVR